MITLIPGNKVFGNWERKEKQNQPDLPDREQGSEVRREELHHGAVTGVSAEVRTDVLFVFFTIFPYFPFLTKCH